MSELFLCDKEFEDVRDTYTAKVDSIEERLQAYINDTRAIIQEKAFEGQAADALLGFIELVEESIKDELSDILFRHKAITSQFVVDLAELDDTEF